jgi:hypothetical protein
LELPANIFSSVLRWPIIATTSWISNLSHAPVVFSSPFLKLTSASNEAILISKINSAAH